ALTRTTSNPAAADLQEAMADVTAAAAVAKTARQEFDSANDFVSRLEAKLRRSEAVRLGGVVQQEPEGRYARKGLAEVERFEQPCRPQQAEFFQKQNPYHRRRHELENRKRELDTKLPQRRAENSRDLATLEDLIAALQPFVDGLDAKARRQRLTQDEEKSR